MWQNLLRERLRYLNGIQRASSRRCLELVAPVSTAHSSCADYLIPALLVV